MKSKLISFLLLTNVYCYAQNLEWANAICNQPVIDTLQTIAYHKGYIYTGGSFNGPNNDFDPGLNVFNLAANSGRNFFITKGDSAGNFIWAKQIVTVGTGISPNYYGNTISIKISENGDIYAAGSFVDTLDIDPSSGVYLLNPSVGGNFYIAKFDALGNLIWANQTNASVNLELRDFKIDHNGNLYAVGNFNGAVDFDPGINQVQLNTVSTVAEAFVCKYNSAGNLIYAKQIATTIQSAVHEIAIDANSNIILYGTFKGPVEFNPGVISDNLQAARSIFLCKLDSLFNFNWVKFNTNYSFNYFTGTLGSITLDESNNIYFSGETNLNIAFDTLLNPFVITGNYPYSNTFIAKVDAFGNFKWTKSFGNQLYRGYNIIEILNHDGLLFISGRYELTSDFDPGIDSAIFTGSKMHSFVEVLDTAGAFVKVNIIGNYAIGWVNINGMVKDENGNIYIAGDYLNLQVPIDFDPGVGTQNLPDTNSIFVVKWGYGNYNSLPKPKLEAGLKIYPNPMTSIATVLLKNSVENAFALVYNSMGQQVYQIKNISGNSFLIDKADLSNGFYYLQLMENNKIVATKKFVIKDN